MSFKVVINDPKTRKSYQREVDKTQSTLIGKKIGDRVKGEPFGLPGYELEIRGGSDKDGFPMRKDVDGTGRKKVLLSGPPGFHPKRKGERKKKLVRGNVVSEYIAQINLKVVKYGSKSIEQLFGIEKPEEKAEEKKEETKEAEKKVEEKAGEEKKSENKGSDGKEKKEENSAMQTKKEETEKSDNKPEENKEKSDDAGQPKKEDQGK